MKKISFLILVVLLAGSFAHAEIVGSNDDEVQGIAEPILDGILEGFKNNDYMLYAQHFDQTLKEAVSKKKFEQTDRQLESTLGEYQHKEFLGHMVKGEMSVVLWKARFSQSEDDILVKLVMTKRGDQFLVTGLWFQ